MFDFDEFIRIHSAELMILAMLLLIIITLLIALPQLLRNNLRKAEWWHEERIKSVDKGIPIPPDDDRSRTAGRIALMVPMVGMISAATVTSFLVVYKSEYLFAVTLAVWVVSGVVSLAAITGGVALMGRIALASGGIRGRRRGCPAREFVHGLTRLAPELLQLGACGERPVAHLFLTILHFLLEIREWIS